MPLLANTIATCGSGDFDSDFRTISGAHFNPAVSLALRLSADWLGLNAGAISSCKVPAAVGGAILGI